MNLKHLAILGVSMSMLGLLGCSQKADVAKSADSLTDALAMASQQGKPVIVDFYADW